MELSTPLLSDAECNIEAKRNVLCTIHLDMQGGLKVAHIITTTKKKERVQLKIGSVYFIHLYETKTELNGTEYCAKIGTWPVTNCFIFFSFGTAHLKWNYRHHCYESISHLTISINKVPLTHPFGSAK